MLFSSIAAFTASLRGARIAHSTWGRLIRQPRWAGSMTRWSCCGSSASIFRTFTADSRSSTGLPPSGWWRSNMAWASAAEV